MKFSKFLKDRLGSILIYLLAFSLVILMLMAFRLPKSLILFVGVILLFALIISISYEYARKKKFYQDLFLNIKRLDKSYLVLETINKPDFYEGKIIYNALYEINKSMCDNVAGLNRQIKDFKNYIELWLHEVKIPLSSLALIMHNKKNSNGKVMEQLAKIDYYLEQILYYERSEVAENDYLIKEVNLKKIIHNVALKNKNELLYYKIELKMSIIWLIPIVNGWSLLLIK